MTTDKRMIDNVYPCFRQDSKVIDKGEQNVMINGRIEPASQYRTLCRGMFVTGVTSQCVDFFSRFQQELPVKGYHNVKIFTAELKDEASIKAANIDRCQPNCVVDGKKYAMMNEKLGLWGYANWIRKTSPNMSHIVCIYDCRWYIDGGRDDVPPVLKDIIKSMLGGC
jgi:hypothetical protein